MTRSWGKTARRRRKTPTDEGKAPQHKSSKKDLDGIYDVLSPVSTVINTKNYTSIIKETKKRRH